MFRSLLSACLIWMLACAPVAARMVQIPSQGFMVPQEYINGPLVEDFNGNFGNMNGATIKIAFIGRVYSNDLNFRKGLTSKNIQKVEFGAETVTCAGCTSNLQIDIEGVSLSAGPPQQPDGTIAGGGSALSTKLISTITQNTWQSGMPNLTAVAPVHYGDLIAVVYSYASYDSGVFKIQGVGTLAENTGFGPQTSIFNGASWANVGTTGPPNFVLDFDDGTVGSFAQALPFNAGTTDAYNSGSAFTEVGLVFSLPYDAQVDQICTAGNVADSSTTGALELTDYDGSTNTLASVALDGHFWRQTGGTQSMSCAPIPIQNLRRNKKYVVGLKATSASAHNLTATSLKVANAAHWGLSQGGGTNFGYATRTTGAWSAITTTLRPFAAVIVSAVDDGTGPVPQPIYNGMGGN